MPFTINEKKTYETTPDAVFQAVLGAVEGLQGKVEKQDGAAHRGSRFDKTIHGKVLGDRTRMRCRSTAATVTASWT